MQILQLEQVFDESKFPELTFIPIKEYPYIKSAIRTEGKHITVSGPSGSGKTTVVQRILLEEKIMISDFLWINAREYETSNSFNELFSRVLKIEPLFELINDYLRLVKFIVIDDFHFLSQPVRFEIAKNLKLLHEKNIRFIIIGISSSAEELVGVDAELGIRNDPFDLKTQNPEFSRKLIEVGSGLLNIRFTETSIQQIIDAANGIPSIIHVICRITLVTNGISETQKELKELKIELKDLKGEVIRIFDSKYFSKILAITKGKQQARSVHNTYFDIIEAIAHDTRSEIPIEFLYGKLVKSITDTKERGRKATSFYNCLNNLAEIIELNKSSDLIFYNKTGKTISIEDPSLRFYLNLLDIDRLKSKIHIRQNKFIWDVAVSYASENLEVAKQFSNACKSKGIEVFIDVDHQALMWGKDLSKELTDIYRNQALFMVIIISKDYPEKDWTNFEFINGKDAEKERSLEYLLPIRVDDTHIVGLKRNIGIIDLRNQNIDSIVEVLSEKIESQ